jgi:hypothetical protein
MIEQKNSNVYWNYFLALENYLAKISRYVEIHKDNFSAFSIELAHLLLASASEVDVIMKQLCNLIEPNEKHKNINDYRKCIRKNLPDMINEKAFIPRFSISLNPWVNWEDENPLWWSAYNKVKNERNNFFKQANLKNTLNSIAGLLISIYFYEKVKIEIENGKKCSSSVVLKVLQPDSNLLQLDPNYYPDYLEIG